jgi:hypothetical protein
MLGPDENPHDHGKSLPVIKINADMRMDNPDVAYYDRLSFLV